jgi:hypothetical protein
MNFKINNRHSLSLAVVILYVVPFLFFIFYSVGLMSRNKSWSVLSLGLLLLASCCLGLILFIHYWEEALKYHIREEKSHPLQLDERIEKMNKVTAIESSTQSETSIRTEIQSDLIALNLIPEDSNQPQKLDLEDSETKEQEIIKLLQEKTILNGQLEETIRDFSDYKLFSEEQLKQKSLQAANLQETIDAHQINMEQKQLQIRELETKIRDLNYEIKTLLYLHESQPNTAKNIFQTTPEPLASHPSRASAECAVDFTGDDPTHPVSIENEGGVGKNQIKTSGEASALLRRCISLAQKLSGTNYYGNESSRYWEISTPHYTIDQRRLFDSLRNETGAVTLVYSPRDNRVLFVNNQCKDILGWSPEKFVQSFSSIIQEGLAEWKKSLSLLSASTPEAQARLLMKSKCGQEIMMNCHLGSIPSGVFRNYIIGVLYVSH